MDVERYRELIVGIFINFVRMRHYSLRDVAVANCRKEEQQELPEMMKKIEFGCEDYNKEHLSSQDFSTASVA